MKLILQLIAVYILFFNGCSSEIDDNSSFDELKILVEHAAEGDSTANKKLAFFLDPNYMKTDLDKINFDSILIDNNKYYICLVNNPNPVLNRFAIFDTALRLHLIDESLNGFLKAQKIKINEKEAVIVYENFYSSDSINLQRMSIYSMYDQTFSLAFRSYIQLADDEIIYNQKIESIDSNKIITAVHRNGILIERDSFVFENSDKAYVSNNNYFDNLIEQHLTNLNTVNSATAIYNYASALWSIGVNIEEETKLISREDFSILLGKSWKLISSENSHELFSNSLKVFSFLNQNIGSSIFIAKVPKGKNAENFINISLANSSRGKYTVRFSDKEKIGEHFVQYFNYRCNGMSYILVIKSPHKTYEVFKPIYQSIINSFKMDC